MKYSVDRIEENVCVLENLESEEIIEIELKKLPKGVHEGSIVIINDGLFNLDLEEEQKRRTDLRERLERLKKIEK